MTRYWPLPFDLMKEWSRWQRQKVLQVIKARVRGGSFYFNLTPGDVFPASVEDWGDRVCQDVPFVYARVSGKEGGESWGFSCAAAAEVGRPAWARSVASQSAERAVQCWWGRECDRHAMQQRRIKSDFDEPAYNVGVFDRPAQMATRERFRKFLYNHEDGTVLGRTNLSWGKPSCIPHVNNDDGFEIARATTAIPTPVTGPWRVWRRASVAPHTHK